MKIIEIKYRSIKKILKDISFINVNYQSYLTMARFRKRNGFCKNIDLIFIMIANMSDNIDNNYYIQ